jgi:hypothetical protein
LSIENAGCRAPIGSSADLSMKGSVDMHSFLKPARWIFTAFVVFLSTAPSLQSRPWPRNAPNAADYLIINDNRGGGDVVMVFWLASPLIPPSGQQAARDLLDKYVVVGVVHAHTNKDATFTLLDMDTMSPAIVGTLATIKAAFGRSLGEFGKGIQWFVFANGSVNPCVKGGMAVRFENENYTYVTPVPGCPTT